MIEITELHSTLHVDDLGAATFSHRYHQAPQGIARFHTDVSAAERKLLTKDVKQAILDECSVREYKLGKNEVRVEPHLVWYQVRFEHEIRIEVLVDYRSADMSFTEAHVLRPPQIIDQLKKLHDDVHDSQDMPRRWGTKRTKRSK